MSCRATSTEGRPIVADNDVSAPRSAVATSRASRTSASASGPTAVVTAEADTRTGMLATHGSARSRRECGMDATDMLPNAVAAGSPFDARPRHHQAAGDVDADGGCCSGWATCSSGPTVDRARYRVIVRPGIMRATCWSCADVFGGASHDFYKDHLPPRRSWSPPEHTKVLRLTTRRARSAAERLGPHAHHSGATFGRAGGVATRVLCAAVAFGRFRRTRAGCHLATTPV